MKTAGEKRKIAAISRITAHLYVQKVRAPVPDAWQTVIAGEECGECRHSSIPNLYLWWVGQQVQQLPLKQNRHGHLHGRDAQTAFSMHRVAFTARTGYDVPRGKHASHLCNNRNCFNPAHLEEETPAENNSRKGCPGEIYCSVHGHAIVDLCIHRPHCIRAPREDVSCFVAMREQDPMGWASQQTIWTASSTSRASTRQSSGQSG